MTRKQVAKGQDLASSIWFLFVPPFATTDKN